MQPTEDERVLAALSHASIVANVVNLSGLIATALIWTKQRDRSPYVRAHSLQALVYQGAVLLIGIFLGLFWAMCLALSLLPVILRPDLYRTSPPSYAVWIGVLGLIALIGFVIVATLYGLYGAYQAYRGRPFRYLLAGRLARSVFDTPPHAAPVPSPAAPPVAVEPAAEVAPAVQAVVAPIAPAVVPTPVAPVVPASVAPPAPVVPVAQVVAPAAPAVPPTPVALIEPAAAPPAPKRRSRRPPSEGN